MILGLGQDIIDIRRIEKTLERFGEKFKKRVYTDIEIAKSDQRLNQSSSYAKRYAAKEACAKALGTGFAKGVYWRDIGVINLPSGQPSLHLTGGAKKQLFNITPKKMYAKLDLTITDDYPYAQAIVIITALFY
ncbi:MAG: holo-ACP synthase [Alphaproteobacteria bacterium]|nr:holo-ACP synthase [Alphaproteobacteria bacterium]